MKKVIFCIFSTAFLFSTMEIALKLGGSNFDSLQLTFLRFIIGGLVLLPFAMKEYKTNYIECGKSISAKDVGWLAMLGTLCIPISMLCFQLGVERCNAATAAPIACLNPMFTMLIAHIFTSEKMNKAKWIAFFTGMVAFVFLTRIWDVQEGNTVLGFVFMFSACATFGAYTVLGKRSLARIGLFTQTSISFILGSAVLLIVMLILGRPVLDNVVEYWKTVLYLGVMATGMGYLSYFVAIKNSDATTGSIAFYIKPIIAPVLAITILHETILWNTIIGILLLLAASALTLYDGIKKKKEKDNINK